MAPLAVPPWLCLITDRRRLGAGRGHPRGEWTATLLTQVAAAAQAGVSLVIVREHDLEARALAGLVRAVRAAVRGTATRVLVNDRLDVALATGAEGVHLRERSVTARDARHLAPPGFLIGRSVHDVEGAAQAGPVDYLLAGTVYPTVSKPDTTPWLGLAGLAAVVAAATVPVLAIGGIASADEVRQVRGAGAAGVGVIGGFQPGPREADLVTGVQNCVYNLRSGFDMPLGLP
ncbi:MAG: thiamine phosphate synthase [Vicinamibacterales bacterium]|nr:thiamine phosphate synthase [Vicinamibacterales bacterium]